MANRKRSQEPEAKPKTWDLTIYLMRPEVTTYEAALREDDGGGDRRTLDMSPNVIRGRLIVNPSPAHPPDWQGLLQQGTANPITGLRVSSASAVLLTRAQGRVFALTFGQGRRMLNQDGIDSGFGLRVVLNSVDPEKIRSVDLANFEAVSRLRRTQVSRLSSLDYFGVEPAQDLLRALVGVPRDGSFAKTLVGSDSLHLSATLTLREVTEKLEKALAHSLDDGYKKHFAWVDNLRIVKGSDAYEQLNEALVDVLNGDDLNRVHLAPPEVVDWRQLHQFRFTSGERDSRHDELELRDYLKTHPSITVDHLHDDHVVSYSSDGAEYNRWSVFKSLVAEVTGTDGGTYVLMQGLWYRAEPDFVKLVDEAVGRVPVSKIAFADAFESEREEVYNGRICGDSKGAFALLDQVFIPYGGRSKVEPCDILTDGGCFVHVKKGTRSANLSHLFLQGTVSAEAFRADAKFRETLRVKLPKTHRSLIPEEAPRTADYSICYAIAAKPNVKIPSRLPFFSRVSLMQSARMLGAFGYSVNVAHIKTKV